MSTSCSRGSGWSELGGSATGGGISNTPGRSVDPALASDGQGRVVVAWRDDDVENQEVFLRRFDGAQWEEILGSGSGGGVSNQTVDAYSIDFAASDTRICVVREGLAAIDVEVAMRCVDLAP